MPRDLEKERESELAAIWGSDGSGGQRYPKRRRGASKVVPLNVDGDADMTAADPTADDVLSDWSDNDDRENAAPAEREEAKKKKRKTEKNPAYRLHCFVEPGTEKNDVRTVFEAYNPKVDMRTSQKGSLLNKTHFAVLTFPNKAMALHAVQTLDGTNQRNLIGTHQLKLSLMLSRAQSKIVRKKTNKENKQKQRDRLMKEAQDDTAFIQRFLKENLRTSASP